MFGSNRVSWVFLAMVSVIGIVGLNGCCSPNPHAHSGSGWDTYVNRAYCDDSGCYQCDVEELCWEIPNEDCSEDFQCEWGEFCTNIGCAKPCVSEDDCEFQECLDGICTPKGFDDVKPKQPKTVCEDDSDCSVQEFCESGKCLPKCKSDDGCAPGEICTSCGKCQPEEKPATCGSSAVYCSDTELCGDGKSCHLGLCRFDCVENGDCPKGQLCDGDSCVQDENPTDPECTLDFECDVGLCVNGFCLPLCSNSSECDDKMICSTGICQPDYLPVQS